MIWEKITAIAALISIAISVVALLVAKSGSEKSSLIASEALKTARQSNDIALGRLRESPVIEIFSYDELLDFTNVKVLKEKLKITIGIRNSGEVAIDGLSMELIGIEPLTYPEHNPDNEIRPLPSIKANLGLDTTIQPDALTHIDMRIPLLRYLKELSDIVIEKNTIYKTVINVILQPKAIGDSLPSGVLSSDTQHDRKLIKLRFKPEVLNSEIAKKLLNDEIIPHRVYSP